MGGSQSTPFSKELENYSIITKNQENNITFLSHKETEKQYLLRELTFNDENIYARSLEAHKKRRKLSPDNLTHLIREQGKQIDHLCSNIYKVYAIWEYPCRFLSQEINQRAAQNRKFQLKELQSIFASCIVGMSTLQQNKIRHECLTTKSIALDNDGIVKVCDPLASNNQTNFDRIYQNRVVPHSSHNLQSIYLSPEQCQSLDNRNSYTNSYKNDIYVMALILLECGLLKPQYSIYRNNFQKINNSEIEISLDKFQREYGKQLRSILELMLKTDEKDRPDWLHLKQFAKKYASPMENNDGGQIEQIQYARPPQQISNYPNSQSKYQSYSPNRPVSHLQEQNRPLTYLPQQNRPISNLQQHNRPNFPQYVPQNQFPHVNYTKSYNQNPFIINSAGKSEYNNPQTLYQPQSFILNNLPPTINQYTSYQTQVQPQIRQYDANRFIPERNVSYERYQKQPVYQGAKNQSIFTDPKLLMMVRGEVPFTESFKSPQVYSQNTEKRQIYKSDQPIQSLPQTYQTGYLFSQNNEPREKINYISTQNTGKQTYISQQHNRIPNQTESETKSKNWSQQKTSKPTIQSNNPTQNNAQQRVSEQFNQSNIKHQNPSQELQYVIETFRQGSRYEGFKLNDQRHGKGKFYYLDGGLYDGEWKYNKMDGEGSLYYQSGKLAYQGGWRDDKFQGYGVLYNQYPIDLRQEGGEGFDYTDFDGIDQYWEKYQGQFQADFKKGRGKLVLANGQWFEGYFDDDMVEGEGEFHCLDNSIVRGVWSANHLQN